MSFLAAFHDKSVAATVAADIAVAVAVAVAAAAVAVVAMFLRSLL